MTSVLNDMITTTSKNGIGFGIKIRESTHFSLLFLFNGRKGMRMAESYPNGWTVEKRRNCSLQAISTLLTAFSKDWYCRHVKTKICFGKA